MKELNRIQRQILAGILEHGSINYASRQQYIGGVVLHLEELHLVATAPLKGDFHRIEVKLTEEGRQVAEQLGGVK